MDALALDVFWIGTCVKRLLLCCLDPFSCAPLRNDQLKKEKLNEQRCRWTRTSCATRAPFARKRVLFWARIENPARYSFELWCTREFFLVFQKEKSSLIVNNSRTNFINNEWEKNLVDSATKNVRTIFKVHPCISLLFLASCQKKKKNVERSKLNLRTFSRVKVGGYCAQIEGFFRPCPRHDIPCRKRLVTLNLPPTKLPIDDKKG